MAKAALEGGAPDIALRISSQTLARNPSDVDAVVVRGNALAALGEPRDAEAAFRGALALERDSVEARLGLGRIALGSDPAAAEALFLEVLARDPRNAKALNDLGIARDLQGRHGDAQDAYRHALGVAPTMQAATVNLALSLALSGRASEGARLLPPIASSRGASARMRHDMAAVSAMAGDRPQAESLLAPDLTGPQLEQTLRSYGALSPSPGAGGTPN